MSGRVWARCMGGFRCNHQLGACTADPEYQQMIREKKAMQDPNFVMTDEVIDELKRLTAPVGFGIALTMLKAGRRVTRQGWNGRGMYIYMVPENRYKPTTPAGFKIAAQHRDGLVPYQAYVAMKTVDETVVPWLCSQSDLLAEDWLILDN